MRPIRSTALALVASCLLILPQAGCSPEQLEAKRAEVAAQRDTLEQAKDRLAAADAAAKEQLERTQAELAEANRLLEEAQTDAERSQLTAAIANLRASAAAGQAQIASNAADLAAVKVSIAGANTALESMDKILAEYKNPTDPLGQTVHNIAPFLPEPIRLPLVWGITLAIPLFRLAKVNGAFNSVVRSFEALKEAAPNVEQAIAENKKTISKIQTPLAKKLVDKAQREA